MVSESGGFTAQAFYRYLKEEKRLMGVRCRACGNLAGQARPMCPACHSADIEWHQFSGKARLSTFTCISIVPVYMAAQGYGRDNPYCTGIVTLEESITCRSPGPVIMMGTGQTPLPRGWKLSARRAPTRRCNALVIVHNRHCAGCLRIRKATLACRRVAGFPNVAAVKSASRQSLPGIRKTTGRDSCRSRNCPASMIRLKDSLQLQMRKTIRPTCHCW